METPKEKTYDENKSILFAIEAIRNIKNAVSQCNFTKEELINFIQSEIDDLEEQLK